jgi:CVNH domain
VFKVNLNRAIKALCVLIFVFSVALIARPLSAVAAPNSYPLNCEDIKIYGSVLEANCRKSDQSLNETNLLLRGIENIDGTLKVTSSYRPANFDESCRGISIRGDMISAQCRTRNGRWVSTSLRINGIENIDGELKYTSEQTNTSTSEQTNTSVEVDENLESIIREMKADQEFRSRFPNDKAFEDYLNRFRSSWYSELRGQ